MPIARVMAGWIGVVVLLAAPVRAETEAPVSWSPDGQWLLYTLATAAPERVLEAGWLYRTEPVKEEDQADKPLMYQIWATHLETKTSVLLARSSLPMSSAAWRSDGTAVAYSRVIDSGGRGEAGRVFQVVVQEDPERVRVLFERTLPDLEERSLDEWEGSRVAWSHDGVHLALSDPLAERLLILRAENGRLLKEVEGARDPSWSPDGKHLAFYRGGLSQGLYTIDENFGEPRLLKELSRVEDLPTPVWERDSRSLMVAVVGSSQTRRGRSRGVTVDLLELDLSGGEPQPIMTLVHPPLDTPAQLGTLSLAHDAQFENVLHVANVAGRVSELVWTEARKGETRKRFYPLDQGFALGGLCLSPIEFKAGMRVGGRGVATPVATVDPDSGDLEAIVPDEAARFAWLGLLAGAVREVLVTELAGEKPEGVRISGARLSLLPAPVELGGDTNAPSRLIRISRMGRAVCELEPGAGEALTEENRRRLTEARLLFQYTRLDLGGEGFEAARSALDALERTSTELVERDRLACLRVQVDQATGEDDRARASIRYLRENRLFSGQVVEETAQGFYVRDEPDAVDAWLAVLARFSEDGTGAGIELHGDSLVPIPPEPGIIGERESRDGGRVDTVPMLKGP